MKQRTFRMIKQKEANAKVVTYLPYSNDGSHTFQIETQSYIKFNESSIDELKLAIKKLNYNIKNSLRFRDVKLTPTYYLVITLPDINNMPRVAHKTRFSLQISFTGVVPQTLDKVDKTVLDEEITKVINLLTLFGLENTEYYKIYIDEK